MKISTKGRYALRMMLDLARHQGDGFVALKDIAARQNISKKYLEQIVPVLTRGGFLLTNRGYQGGYRLSRPPEKYTVGGNPAADRRGAFSGGLSRASAKPLPKGRRVYNPSGLAGA